MTDPIEDVIDETLGAQRKDCWCGSVRKPCQYHAGMEEGAEVALETMRAASAADMDDWWQGKFIATIHQHAQQDQRPIDGPERDARFAPDNDRIWGPGNWTKCHECTADSHGLPVYHHRKAHR